MTTSTDVYALGVLLYQLVTGWHPTGALDATVPKRVRAIVEDDPRLASAVAGVAAASIAAARRTTPDTLRRALKGDLDNMLSMALQKAPVRRYHSVAAFADDIRRHLRREPVRARSDTWRYRAHKFVQRHTAAVAAGAAAFVTLAAAVVVTTSQMFEVRRQRDQAAFEARRAEASSEFMRHLVTQIGSQPMTMKQVLDRGREALEQQYAGDPAFQARMLMQMSGPYMELGDSKTSADMMARALAIATQLDDPALLISAHCGRAFDLLQDRPRLDEARHHLAEAARHIARLPSASPSMGQCAHAETELALAERRFDDAIRHGQRAVELIEQSGGPVTTRLTSALNNLGVAYGSAGRYHDAVRTYRRVTELSRQIGRGQTVSVVASLQNEAVNLRRSGRWIEADRVFLEAADVARGVVGTGRVPGYLLANRARHLVSLARGDEAAVLLHQARHQGDLSPTFVAIGDVVDALLLIERGDTAAARALHAKLADKDSALPRTNLPALRLLDAALAQAEGRPQDARDIVASAITAEGYPSKQSGSLPELLEYAGRLAFARGDFEESVRWSREAVGAAEAQFGREFPSAHTGRARLTLGIALGGSDARAARAELESAASTLELAVGATHPWTQEARRRLAQITP